MIRGTSGGVRSGFRSKRSPSWPWATESALKRSKDPARHYLRSSLEHRPPRTRKPESTIVQGISGLRLRWLQVTPLEPHPSARSCLPSPADEQAPELDGPVTASLRESRRTRADSATPGPAAERFSADAVRGRLRPRDGRRQRVFIYAQIELNGVRIAPPSANLHRPRLTRRRRHVQVGRRPNQNAVRTRPLADPLLRRRSTSTSRSISTAGVLGGSIVDRTRRAAERTGSAAVLDAVPRGPIGWRQPSEPKGVDGCHV
jgi:hypothetical protein